jgi:hypothetical protein
MRNIIYAYKILVTEPKWKRHFRDYVLIRILIWILKDIRREVVDSIQLVEDRAVCWALVSMATDLQVP